MQIIVNLYLHQKAIRKLQQSGACRTVQFTVLDKFSMILTFIHFLSINYLQASAKNLRFESTIVCQTSHKSIPICISLLGLCNKTPQTARITEIYFHTVLEAGNLRSRCGKDWFPVRHLPWLASSCCILTWSFPCAHAILASLPTIIRTSVYWITVPLF